MKASAGQIANAIDRVANGGTDIRLFLLHGPDEAGAMEHAAHLGRVMGSDVERVDLDGATLKSQPGRLADEAAALSLFGGKRYIRVTGVGEESAEAAALLLGLQAVGAPVMMIAPGVKGTGKLVKLAVSSPAAMSLACYIPEGADAVRLVVAIGRDHGLRIGNAVAARMIAGASGDRAVLTREIEKIALYLDAAPDRLREVDDDVLATIGANIDEAEMAGAITSAIAGDTAAFGAEMAAIESAGMAIPMLRSLARRLTALAEMRAAVDDGDSPDTVVERHRVFWKEKATTINALRRWSAPQIAAGVTRIRRAERTMMSGGGTPPPVAAAHDMLALVRAIERR
ncbi:DNA polymerase III subunit delta [Sphingomonas sp. RS2018]